MNKGNIFLLPEHVSSKIAAGEVIERPSSVVKELIENALDANSSTIKIEIFNGGKKKIVVSDDGDGICPEDLEKTVMRFATSKIRSEKDLDNILTFGFRGEALAAISTVSNFYIKSGKKQNDTYELIVDFGKVLGKNPASPYFGTIVKIEDLFKNLPARYKFLKSDAGELREITKLIKQFIIINDNVAFHYFAADERIFYFNNTSDILTRASILLDESKLKYFEDETDNVKINAVISLPEVQRNRADNIIIAINKRIVKDPMLIKAILQAYNQILPSNKYPCVAINITISPDVIDVNVHPGKSLVKWLNPQDIYKDVYDAIRKNIGNTFPVSAINDNITFVNSDYKAVDKFHTYTLDQIFDGLSENNVVAIENSKDDIEFKIIGQLYNTIIVIEKSEEILFIDQHIAHERILFEEYEKSGKIDASQSTILLDSIVIEMEEEEIELLLEGKDYFVNFGFDYDLFGKNAIKLLRVPVYFPKTNIEETFLDLTTDIKNEKGIELKASIIASLSCSAAVKAGELLTNLEIHKMVNRLLKCANPYTCPHGRKIIYNMTKQDLFKKFNRICSPLTSSLNPPRSNGV